MSTSEQEKDSGFKVVDKRRFDETGKHKDGDVSESSKKGPSQDIPKSDAPTSRPPMTFMLFVQSLAHQAMMGLGLIPWPDSNLVRKELVLAKETIDIIGIIKEKTAGNLSADDQKNLESILYQLRSIYLNACNESPKDDNQIVT